MYGALYTFSNDFSSHAVSSARIAWSGYFFFISRIISFSEARSTAVTKSFAALSSTLKGLADLLRINSPAFFAV